jgi:cytidine deaminase
MCHEVEPYCGAFRLDQRIVASVCLHRHAGGRTVVLSPCGVCRERLAAHGPDVLVAVADRQDPRVVVWRTLKAVLPDYWMTAFPDDIDPGWLACGSD